MTVSNETAALDYDRMTEGELVAFARSGHQQAFRAIMQRCNQRLFRIARSVVRDDVEAEDVVQEAYGRAFTRLDGFREEASLFTWLTSITLNEARGRLRKRRPTTGMEAVEAAQEAGQVIMFPSVYGSNDPESDAARMEARRLLERAVDELPEPFRLVFIMREMEECSVEETAANLALKPETVKTRLHRARKLLHQSLDQKLASVATEAFPFMGARCERITARVLDQLAPRYGWASVRS